MIQIPKQIEKTEKIPQSQNMIPLKELYSESEQADVCMAICLVVELDGKLYNVTQSEKVPQRAKPVRTVSGALLGIPAVAGG